VRTPVRYAVVSSSVFDVQKGQARRSHPLERLPSILVVEEFFQTPANAAIIERAIADTFLSAYGGRGEGEAYPGEVADLDPGAQILGFEICEATIGETAHVLILTCRP